MQQKTETFSAEQLQDEKYILAKMFCQTARAFIDVFELSIACENKSVMKEKMTITDIAFDLKISKSKAGQIMRAVGHSTGKMRRAYRCDVIAYWLNYGKEDDNLDNMEVVKNYLSR